MSKRKLPRSQLPLYLPAVLEGILKTMPPEKADKLKESGLIPDIAAALNGMEESLFLEAVKQIAEKKRGKPHVAIALSGNQGRIDTLLRFDHKPNEAELLAVLKKRRVLPATIQDILDFAPQHRDMLSLGPLVASEFETIDGCRLAACISRSASNDEGFDAKWVATAPHGAYFAASSQE